MLEIILLILGVLFGGVGAINVVIAWIESAKAKKENKHQHECESVCVYMVIIIQNDMENATTLFIAEAVALEKVQQ